MHNRKRRPKGEKEPASVVKKRRAKVQAYSKLSQLILARRKAKDYGPKALMLTAKMALVNPDFYTLWNYRREIILHQLGTAGDEEATDQEAVKRDELLKRLCTEELELSTNALVNRNPKCYYAWHQRKWIIAFGCVNLERELTLCDEFLARDERNFHCWSYRRCVIARLSKTPLQEIEATDRLIERNFSNSSAWHQRSLVLSSSNFDLQLEVVASELIKVRDAIFTEPDDQSVWMYHRWLMSCVASFLAGVQAQHLGQSVETFYSTFMNGVSGSLAATLGNRPDVVTSMVMGAREGESDEGSKGREETGGARAEDEIAPAANEAEGAAKSEARSVVLEEMNMCRELMTIEGDSRWPRLQLIYMMDKTGAHFPELESEWTSEREQLLSQLIVLDPAHQGYYRHLSDHAAA